MPRELSDALRFALRSMARDLRPDAGDTQANSVKARASREIQRPAVGVTPGQVGGILGSLYSPQMLSLG